MRVLKLSSVAEIYSERLVKHSQCNILLLSTRSSIKVVLCFPLCMLLKYKTVIILLACCSYFRFDPIGVCLNMPKSTKTWQKQGVSTL